MAIAVASSNSATNAGSSVTITKPTGLATGDLMVAMLSVNAGVGTSVNTLSGWTLIADRSATNSAANMQYKIATAGDVAASNFTFTATSGSAMAGAILRVTGATSTPLEFSDSDVNNAASSATVNFSTSVTPQKDGSLLCMVFATQDGNSGAGSIGSYVINGTNPTWTEYFDYSVDSGTADPILGSAAAILSTAASITSYGATLSNTKDDHAGVFAVFTPITDAAGTHDLLSATGTFFAPTAQAGTTGTHSLLLGSPTLNSPSGEVEYETWTEQTKNPTTWTLETK